MVGGSTFVENSLEITATNTSLGRNDAETEFEGSIRAPLEGPGQAASACSSCFGRVIASAKKLPSEGSMFSGYGLRFRKSRHCLRKLNCISSCDVLPSVTSTTTAPFDKHRSAHNIKRRSEALGESRNRKNAPMSSAGSMVHRSLRHRLGGLLCEKGREANVDQSPAGSRRAPALSFWAGNWCLMRPTVIKSDAMVSSNTLSRVNSALQTSNNGHSRGDREISRTPSDSCETTSVASLSNEEVVPQRLVGNNNRGSGFDGRELGAMDGGDRRNTTGLWIDGLSSSTPRSLVRDRHNSSSSVFSGSSSASRATRVPFLFGMAHRTRSLEVISSPLSYMSSPDVHLSNPDMVHTYASTLQSPSLSRAASSPEYQEGYHVQSSSETPIFRSFRQFPLQPFEENQECFTYGGLSEQVFMWEANLILGGIPSQDQYRDLRLDIDNMSYEDLLALEESMGNVCTGLEKDAISRCLRSKVYSVNNAINSTQADSEIKCSICQVDFEEGNELGILQCGHNHHFFCIEAWLLQKNQCPICKASASLKTGS